MRMGASFPDIFLLGAKGLAIRQRPFGSPEPGIG